MDIFFYISNFIYFLDICSDSLLYDLYLSEYVI